MRELLLKWDKLHLSADIGRMMSEETGAVYQGSDTHAMFQLGSRWRNHPTYWPTSLSWP